MKRLILICTLIVLFGIEIGILTVVAKRLPSQKPTHVMPATEANSFLPSDCGGSTSCSRIETPPIQFDRTTRRIARLPDEDTSATNNAEPILAYTAIANLELLFAEAKEESRKEKDHIFRWEYTSLAKDIYRTRDVIRTAALHSAEVRAELKTILLDPVRDKDFRAEIAYILGGLPHADAVDILLERAVVENDWWLRVQIVRALGQKKKRDSLRQQLAGGNEKKPDYELRIERRLRELALANYGDMASKFASEEAIKALEAYAAESEETRQLLLQIIHSGGELTTGWAIRSLLDGLNNDRIYDSIVKHLVSEAIIESDRAVKIRSGLKNSATTTANDFRRTLFLDLIRTKEREEIRTWAAEILFRESFRLHDKLWHLPAGAEPLKPSLRVAKETRKAFLRSLGRLYYNEESGGVRYYIVMAISEAPWDCGGEVLVHALRYDPDKIVRLAALRNMRTMEGAPDLGPYIQEALSDPCPQVRELASSIISRLR